jgi:hypothetical protein
MTQHRPTLWALLVLAIAGGAGLAATSGNHVEAADHLDPPARTNPDSGGTDRNADIADVYAWHTGSGATGRVTTVLSFSGPNAPSATQEVACDRDVLYSIHLSNDADLDDEFTIEARFGLDDLGNCFVQISGAPGMAAGTSMIVPVEVATTRGDVDVYAGLRDDAFFFDLVGFREMVDGLDGTPAYPAGMGLRMINDRDFFAGLNTSAIVVEFPLTAVSPTNQSFRVWASTARFGG